MEKIKVKLSYLTYSQEHDFEDISKFTENLSIDYDLEIKNEKTDALGGGLYEFVLEIISNVDFSEIAKDYIEDGVKVGIGYFWKPIFKRIKELFQKNPKYNPDIAVAKFIFNDIEIIIYPLYQNSIEEVIDEVIQKISQHFIKIKNQTKLPLRSIHIPIFNHVDIYELCAYRVKLDVDENISSFSKNDYFKLWGIRCGSKTDFIYDLSNQSTLKTRFYTQEEYNILFDQKF